MSRPQERRRSVLLGGQKLRDHQKRRFSDTQREQEPAGMCFGFVFLKKIKIKKRKEKCVCETRGRGRWWGGWGTAPGGPGAVLTFCSPILARSQRPAGAGGRQRMSIRKPSLAQQSRPQRPLGPDGTHLAFVCPDLGGMMLKEPPWPGQEARPGVGCGGRGAAWREQRGPETGQGRPDRGSSCLPRRPCASSGSPWGQVPWGATGVTSEDRNPSP